MLIEVDAFMNLTIGISNCIADEEDVTEEGKVTNHEITDCKEDEEEEEIEEEDEEGFVDEDMVYIKGINIRCVQLPEDLDLRSHVARFTKKLKQIAAQNAPRPIKGG